MHDAEFIEHQLLLDVVLREWPVDITERSKELFTATRHKIEEPMLVILAYLEKPQWDYLTYVSDSKRKSLCFNGFAWGHGGTAPHGLLWLFQQIGFKVTINDIMSYSTKPGFSGIQPDGLMIRWDDKTMHDQSPERV